MYDIVELIFQNEVFDVLSPLLFLCTTFLWDFCVRSFLVILILCIIWHAFSSRLLNDILTQVLFDNIENQLKLTILTYSVYVSLIAMFKVNSLRENTLKI